MISNLITEGIIGQPKIPGDKSISHRSIIIPSISNGICEISNISLLGTDIGNIQTIPKKIHQKRRYFYYLTLQI